MRRSATVLSTTPLSTTPLSTTPQSKPTQRRRRARASLPVRLCLAALAVLCAAAGLCAGANLVALSTLRGATVQLEANLKTASRQDADLTLLAVQQQQTDNQFADAGAWSPLLLPQVRQSIAANAQVSRELSKRIANALKQQSASKAGQQANSSSAQGAQTQGLTKEQRDKVNQLLEANRKAAGNKQQSGDDSSSGKSGTGDGNSTPKPW
ncbi:DUF6466 family protein [Bifidobacterium leontopitheci]|uniref:Cell surface protein n=1 Tax=Bifidobacterium leontopitheci TaxID=2650774 RepID=A0A6I1GTB1_9BIFI|nr:DUF6466 family protein [Bifidobacterium leontopitheci]KAB7791408.1 cell surface protein [Bifidobacterium leontopitheci]